MPFFLELGCFRAFLKVVKATDLPEAAILATCRGLCQYGCLMLVLKSPGLLKIWVFPKIGGTPKSSILIGFSIIFTIHFGGTIIFGNTHIIIYLIFFLGEVSPNRETQLYILSNSFK